MITYIVYINLIQKKNLVIITRWRINADIQATQGTYEEFILRCQREQFLCFSHGTFHIITRSKL